MLLSELLDARVMAADGTPLGVVVDARFRRRAPARDHEAELELVALIVSPRRSGSLYGYERGRVNAPALVNAVITWLHRHARIIPWECVATVVSGEVRLGVDVPVIPLDVRRPIPTGR